MAIKELKDVSFTMKCGQSDTYKIECMSKFYGISKSDYLRMLVSNDFERLARVLDISKNNEFLKLVKKKMS